MFLHAGIYLHGIKKPKNNIIEMKGIFFLAKYTDIYSGCMGNFRSACTRPLQ